jgi:flagellar biosynthesis activator protein FlaF
VYSSPLQAYETVNKKTMSGREIEAEVLTKAARKLKDCQDSWNADDRNEKLTEALKFNQLVWSIFQGELKKEDNPLNRKLRADLLRLSAFVDRRIFETIADPSPEKLNIVININNNIAAGLREGQANDR